MTTKTFSTFSAEAPLVVPAAGDSVLGIQAGETVRFLASAIDLIVLNVSNPLPEIQAALDAANSSGGGVVRHMQPGTFLLDDHLIIYSNTSLVRGPATRYKKIPNAIGNVCLIRNANMNSSTRDRNISLIGGIWDGNVADNVSQLVSSDKTGALAGVQGDISLIGVDFATIRDTTIEQCNGFAVQLQGDFSLFENIDFGVGTRRDGVHINGPSKNGVLKNIRGPAHDDFVALNAWDWTISGVTVGDITDFNIDGLHIQPYLGVTGCAVKLLSGTRVVASVPRRGDVRRISIANVSGLVTGSAAFDALSNFDQNNPALPAGAGEVSDITIRGIKKLRTINSQCTLRIDKPCSNFLLDGVSVDTTSLGPLVSVTNNGVIDRLVVNGLHVADVPGSAGGYDGYFQIKGIVKELVITNSRVVCLNNGTSSSGGDAGMIQVVDATGWVDRIIIQGVSQKFGGSIVCVESNALGGILEIVISDSFIEKNKHHFLVRKGTVNVKATNCSFSQVANNLARVEGGSFSMREASCTATYGTGIPYTLISGSIRHIGNSLPINALKTINNGYQSGDMLFNSNAALSCGIGIAVSDGSVWKNIFSGSVY